MEAETDATKGQESKQQMRDEELFKAAESGDSSVFMSLSPQQLAKSLSFRNEDVSEKHYGLCCCKFVSDLGFTKEKKSDIKSYDEGWAPLHSAASIGKAGLVEILLTRGLCCNLSLTFDDGFVFFVCVDVNVKNNGGRNALHYVASKGWLEIAQLYFKSDEVYLLS
uniref:Uncharacterized protein n=1 Tax=Brassica oleracea TaxID=3712 RepID=A0A3P6D5B5_BRAOL|nr:unnamed protein product [Brassica oleracea]